MGCGNTKIIEGACRIKLDNVELMKDIQNPRSSARDDNLNQNLADYIINEVNFNVYNIQKYYKNQKPSEKEELFTDELFPPNENSVFGIINDGSYSDPFEYRREEYLTDFNVKKGEIEWKRASELFEDSSYSIFEGKIEFDDIKQGSVGNCYFMAAISAMTEYPQLICQIFKTLSVQSNGCYQIGMKFNGEWKIVILDDYFPCNKGTKIPCFSKPNGSEIWVMLLEKAWAKINGGYLNIVGGWSTQVLAALTPFSIDYVVHDRHHIKNHLWERIKEADSNGYVMSCCSKREQHVSEMGIVMGHAFSLISAREKVINGKNIKLVQIRNPWGFREWKGDWSDNSNLWTEEAKIAFGFSNSKDDGLFWMSWDDYLKCYEVTEICKVSSPRCYKYIKISKENLFLSNVFEFKTFNTSIVDISIIKKNWRFNRKISSEQELMINVIVVKVDNNNLVYIASSSESFFDPSMELKLQKGTYLIYVHANYKFAKVDKPRKYCIYLSSDNYFDLKFKGIDKDYHLLKEIIITHLKLKNKETGYVQLIHHSFQDTKFGYLYIWNNTKYRYKVVGKNECENYTLLTEFDGRVNIPPNYDWIVLGLKNHFYKGASFYINYENQNSDSNDYSACIRRDNSMFKETSSDMKFHNLEFDFVYKNLDNYNFSNILTKLDPIQTAKENLLKKYPEEMKEILSIPPLNDGVKVIFKNKYSWTDSHYIGEWHMEKPLVKHGRGKYYWDDGTHFIGTFLNDKQNGQGKIYYKNGDIVDINFIDGKNHGIGTVTNNQGVRHIEYKNGEFVRWL